MPTNLLTPAVSFQRRIDLLVSPHGTASRFLEAGY